MLSVTLRGTVEEGWHIEATASLEKAQGVEMVGGVKENADGTFTQMLRITEANYSLSGFFRYMLCNDQTCLAPKYAEFAYHGTLTTKDAQTAAAVEAMPAPVADETELMADEPLTPADSIMALINATADSMSAATLTNHPLWQDATAELRRYDNNLGGGASLWTIVLFGFIGGLLAVLTPCVWPVIPLTVSFFMKREQGVRGALLFGGSIIALFVLLGLVVTFLNGANAMNMMATSAAFNLTCFVVLVLLGLSLLGLFELRLPMKWGDSLDEMVDKTSGVLSIFLMALTLVVVSFSCTAPVVGFLLVEVATQHSLLPPLVGMTSFAVALALPFTLFALFPSWLKRMPRSGAWMGVVKVVMGVLEIAFAMKFFSIADQAYGWNILSPVAFLVIWALLFGGLSVYIYMKVRAMVPRLLFSLLPLALAAYLVQGIFTGHTELVSAFKPVEVSASEHSDGAAPVFHDYEDGMAYAKEAGKPVFLNFTGYGCVNCRKMEGAVFTDARVKQMLQEHFVVIELYVDERTPLTEQLHVTDNGTERVLRTVGDKWSFLESYKFGSQQQPFYVILSPYTAMPLTYSYAYDEDVEKFIDFLNSALKK